MKNIILLLALIALSVAPSYAQNADEYLREQRVELRKYSEVVSRAAERGELLQRRFDAGLGSADLDFLDFAKAMAERNEEHRLRNKCVPLLEFEFEIVYIDITAETVHSKSTLVCHGVRGTDRLLNPQFTSKPEFWIYLKGIRRLLSDGKADTVLRVEEYRVSSRKQSYGPLAVIMTDLAEHGEDLRPEFAWIREGSRNYTIPVEMARINNLHRVHDRNLPELEFVYDLTTVNWNENTASLTGVVACRGDLAGRLYDWRMKRKDAFQTRLMLRSIRTFLPPGKCPRTLILFDRKYPCHPESQCSC